MTVDIPDASIAWIESCLNGDWSLTVDYSGPDEALADWNRSSSTSPSSRRCPRS